MSTIEQLNIDIQANVQKTQATNIDKLATSLQKLKSVLSGGITGLAQVQTQLATLNNLTNLTTASSGINKLANSLNKLKSISFSGFSNKITAISTALTPLRSLDLTSVATAGTSLNRFANSLAKIDNLDTTKLATDMQAISTALTPLTNEFLRGGTSAQSYATALKSISSAKLQAVTNTKALTPQVKNLTSAFAKFTTVAYAIRRITSLMASSIQQSANYTENLNLFAVTYGETYKETLQWTTDIAERFGFATNELVKATGLFMQLSTAIGVANDTGELMSKTLTQLALDFTSFYNVASLDTTIQKLQAGIFSGQTKPLRALGIDVTYQTLDFFLETNEAMAQFNVSSKQLTQSQKAIARLIVTMNAGQNAFGDMSNTIDTTANALRVLEGSWQNLQLAFGDAFLTQPFTDLIILAGGVVQGITAIIRAFVPLREELDYSIDNNFIEGVNTELEEMQENLGLLSFDKFEVLGGQESALAEDLSITNALTAELERQAELYDEIFMSTSGIASKAVEIGEAIRDWFINVDVEGNFESWTENSKLALAGITALFAPKVIAGLATLLKSMVGVSSGMTALTATASILSSVGIFILAKGIIDLIENWDTLSDTMKAISIGVLALTGVIISSLLLVKIGIFDLNSVILATGWGALIIGFGILIFEVIRNLDTLGTFFSNFWQGLANGFASVINWISNAFISFVNFFVEMINTILKPIDEISKFFGGNSIQLKEWNANVNWQPYPQYRADGGTFDLRGGTAVGVVNERGNNELVYSNNSRQIEVANQQSLEENFFNALIRYHSLTADEKQQLTIEIRDKTQSGFVQFISPRIITEAKRVGIL